MLNVFINMTKQILLFSPNDNFENNNNKKIRILEIR